jgi:hypothetical protein
VCYGRKAYVGFFLSVIAGSIIRQNAVALLVRPATDLFFDLPRGSSPRSAAAVASGYAMP